MPVTGIKIATKNKIFINGKNGKRITKLKGGVEIQEDRGNQREENIVENKAKEEVKKDLPLNKLSEEEQKQLKSLMAKLNE